MNPLEFRGTSKQFPGFRLGPIDLTVPRGLVTGLVGANGAGKTTLIKMALGLTHSDAGTVRCVSHDRVGVVFDTPALMREWRVREVARCVAPFYATWRQGEFDRIAAWGGLEPDRKVKELSRGMGMKLQLAIALAHDADLLILDEPTSGLDPLARSELLDAIADFMTEEDRSVLFSTHITTDLERVADHLVVMREGQLGAQGPLHEVIDGYRLVRGPRRDLADVRPLTVGLREHESGWEALMATEDTVSLSADVAIQAPSVEQLVVHLAKEPAHV